jgi:hypothetical protein
MTAQARKDGRSMRTNKGSRGWVLTVGVSVVVSVGLAVTGAGPTTAAADPIATNITHTAGKPRHTAPLPSDSGASAQAAPQGPLPGSGCTVTSASAACELFAKPGTLTVSSAPLPIWGLSATETGPATVPGPVLVVPQGANVSLRVHNGLPGALSIAVPGLLGGPDDVTGAPPGAEKTYEFTASRPGTYLYEAGHTPDGARQAAMGVYGALVVRPASGDGTAYGDDTGAFDDEAVLVLSEMDPAFNANPLGFDLRRFQATYRLINGKAFPETDPVATAAGRRVLLRYVNAGVFAHAMGTLGATQTALGTDGRPLAAPRPLVTAPVPPGGTEDTLVTVPASDHGTKFAVYETAGRLDTAGHRVGTTNQVALGGMLTFLDTGAAPASGDTAGPVARNVSVTPASATALQTVTVRADFSDVDNGGSGVTRAEFVVDDPGIAVGTGSPFTGSFGGPTVTGATATLDLRTANPALSTGRHLVFVRALDFQGNWGVVNTVVLTVSSSGPVTTGGAVTPAATNGSTAVQLTATGDDSLLGGTVDAAEYFLGAAGANGTGTALTLAPGTVTSLSATISTGTLAAQPEGPVTVLVHSHDSFGLWGPTQTLTIGLDRTAPTMDSGIAVPSPTNGRTGSQVDGTAIQVSAAFTDSVSGNLRSPIAAAEGFLDNQNGVTGTGFTFVALDGAFNSGAESTYGLLPLSQLTGLADGTHQVYVHAKDLAGNWGPLAPVALVVDRGGPATAGVTASPATVVRATTSVTVTGTGTDPLSRVTGAEWFEGADPGAGAGHPIAVTSTGPRSASLRLALAPGGFSVGTHTLSVRSKDAAGNWGAPVTVRITVSQLSNTVLADGFESGDTTTWSTATGPVAVTPGAALTGANGLQTTGVGTAAAYLTDQSPLAESAYHLQFQFRPDTLATGTGTVNIAAGQATGGVSLFVVQYRTSGGAQQLRLGARRNTGVVTYTNWLTLAGAGAQTVRVDWAAGTSATESLTVGAATQRLTAFNTGTVRLETLLFGLTGGGAGTTGSASFDAVNATRFTLP